MPTRRGVAFAPSGSARRQGLRMWYRSLKAGSLLMDRLHAAAMNRVIFLLLAALVFASPVFAVLPGEQLADPRLEARARAISQELRCVVCQNQTIDDSDATLAHDLRLIVRERLRAGDTTNSPSLLHQT